MRSALIAAVSLSSLVGCSGNPFSGGSASPQVISATGSEATAAPVAGAAGRDGLNGTSVKTEPVSVGDAVCTFGGAKFIGADGVSYACNGDPGLERVYGLGSAGDKLVTGHEDWSRLGARELQFASLTIESGATVEVASGTVLRSRGPVTLRGTVRVRPGVSGPQMLVRPAPGSYLSVPATPGAGIASVSAFAGDLGDAGWTRAGGRGGISGLQSAAVQSMVRAHFFGGGAGAPSFDSPGCAGGGSVVVVAQGELHLEPDARILADGESCREGGGGGGGGYVVLASKTFLTVEGLVSVRGGNGGANTSLTGAGGGGGGGIVHALAPDVTVVRGFDVTGGQPGGTGTPVTFHARSGGGGGGASAGNGGLGGAVSGETDSIPNFAQDAAAGTEGMIVVTETGPETLL
ncbi:MAG: hypothetical protein M3Y59_13840 [Myxococcota bacterium]|nr:hypothetical protein [Myxococcota bacterium]